MQPGARRIRVRRDVTHQGRDRQAACQRVERLGGAGDVARLLEQVVDDGCRGVILGHLSEKNNTPELARTTVRRALQRAGHASVEVHVAERRSASRPLTAASGLL